MQILDAFSSCCSSSNKNLQLSYATMILKWAFSHLHTFAQFPPSCSFVKLPHQCMDLWYSPSIDAHIFSLPPSILWFVFTVMPCCWLKRKILKANLKFLQQLLRYGLSFTCNLLEMVMLCVFYPDFIPDCNTKNAYLVFCWDFQRRESLPILKMCPSFSLQIAEGENIEVDSKFRALVAVGSLVYLTLSTYTQWFYFSN